MCNPLVMSKATLEAPYIKYVASAAMLTMGSCPELSKYQL